MKIFQASEVKEIVRSRERPWFYVWFLNRRRTDITAWLNCDSPPFVDYEDMLGDLDYWVVEFDCGLQVAFECPHHAETCGLLATEYAPQHVSRHLSHWGDDLEAIPDEAFAADREDMLLRFADSMPELIENRSYQLWRQGDDGNSMTIGEPTSNLDAKCWQAELESHKHKQIYWVSKI